MTDGAEAPTAGTHHSGLPDHNLLPLRPLSHHLALTVYWLSNTMLWGALLHIALQSRLADWYGEAHVGYYLGILGFMGGTVSLVVQIIAGAFSDRSTHRWGRRRPYIAVGSTAAFVALILLGAARSFWPFAGALIFVQISTNLALGPFTALLPDTVSPREHGKASGFMGVARLAGDTGGLVLAALLLSEAALGSGAPHETVVDFHSRRMLILCLILGAFMLLTAAYTCYAIKEKPLRSRPDASVLSIAFSSFSVDIRGNPGFFWLSVSRAITNVGFYMFLEVLFYFVKYTLRDPDPLRTTMFIMLPAIGAAVLSSVPSGILSDRIGRRPLVFAAQFTMAGAVTLFALSPDVNSCLIAAVPAGLAYGVFTAVEWAFACNLLPKGAAARYLGVWNASAVVPQVLAFPIAGAIGSALSSRMPGLGWRADFAIAAACCLIGAYFLRHVQERRPVQP